MFEDNRVHSTFNLRELFPVYKSCPHVDIDMENIKSEDGPPLNEFSKHVLREAAREASRMNDYWIDTDHLLLGIIRVSGCDAARYLSMAGITLQSAREQVKLSSTSRPDYGKPPRYWQVRNFFDYLILR